MLLWFVFRLFRICSIWSCEKAFLLSALVTVR